MTQGKDKKLPHYEMVSKDDPEGIVLGTQKSLIHVMRQVIADFKKNPPEGRPGLTWDEIDYFLEEWGKKKPEIVFQSRPM